MRAFHQLRELLHTLVYIDRQVWVDVVVVGNGIGRTCLTLHHRWVLTGNTEAAVVCRSSMTDNTRVPDMAHAHLTDSFQYSGREVVHFTASIFLNRAIRLARLILIPVKSGKDLVDDNLIRCHELSPRY